MNTTMGRIVSIRSGVSGNRAVVEVDAEAACARCAEGKGCGAGVFGQGEHNKVFETEIPLDLGVREGDVVDLALQPSGLLRAAVLVYGVPLVLAVAFAGLGWWMGVSDVAAVILALSGLTTGLLLARLKLRSTSCLREFTPTVVLRHE